MKVLNTQKLIIERAPACVIQHDETGVVVGDRLMPVLHDVPSNEFRTESTVCICASTAIR